MEVDDTQRQHQDGGGGEKGGIEKGMDLNEEEEEVVEIDPLSSPTGSLS